MSDENETTQGSVERDDQFSLNNESWDMTGIPPAQNQENPKTIDVEFKQIFGEAHQQILRAITKIYANSSCHDPKTCAEDCVASAELSVLQFLNNHPNEIIRNLAGYIFRSARREAFRIIRGCQTCKKRNLVFLDDKENNENAILVKINPRAAQTEVIGDLADLMQKILPQLNEKEKALFGYWAAGSSEEEIASAFDITVVAVKSAKQRLKIKILQIADSL